MSFAKEYIQLLVFLKIKWVFSFYMFNLKFLSTILIQNCITGDFLELEF